MSLPTVSQGTLPARPLSLVAGEPQEKQAWAGASRFGYAVILLFFGGLGGWAAAAPLASGISASGKIEVETGKKTVQHLEGGLVKEILVREGDQVSKGDVLLRLDPLVNDAQSLVQRSTLISGLAELSRLQAELADSDSMELNAELLEAMDHPTHRTIVEAEMKVFDERRESHENQREIRKERVEQVKTEISGLRIRLDTVHQQMTLIQDELAGVEQLFKGGHVTKSRLLSLRRAQTGLLGQKGAIEASIARSQQRLNELKLIVEESEQGRRAANVTRIKQLDIAIARSRETLGVIDDRLRRVEVRAPASGQVMNLTVKTIGAVTNRAQPLMDIIPDDEVMVLSAKVKAKDIEQVKKGATVKVRLTAFNPRLTPPVDGEVVAVSGDSIPQKKGPDKYKVIIALDKGSLAKAIGDQRLTAGMPASGIIAVGERTMLEYLMTPMTASFELALREP